MKQNSFIKARYWGLTPYAMALKRMLELRTRRLDHHIGDQLIFLEHPPVITMGRRSSQSDLKISLKELKQKGIDFIETDRGGRLTYHGPGQLVVYFIFDLLERGLSVEEFVWKAEEGLRLLLEDYQIKANRDPKNPGLWIGNKKIASVGFHIHRGVSTHGVSLNVGGNFSSFDYFIPCGVQGSKVTDIEKEANRNPLLIELSHLLAKWYSKIFQTPVRFSISS